MPYTKGRKLSAKEAQQIGESIKKLHKEQLLAGLRRQGVKIRDDEDPDAVANEMGKAAYKGGMLGMAKWIAEFNKGR